jgi:aspartyl protease family protein
MSQAVKILVASLLVSALPAHATALVVEALLPGIAVITIDGTRKTLKAGQSHAGVTLVSADSKAAVVDLNGQRQQLSLHQRINASYSSPATREVSISRNALNQYRTTAIINGRSQPVLVDTGANVVAMNAGHAAALGVDYRQGQRARLETAGNTVDAWLVTLDSIDVGGIRVDRVRATVAEGEFPSTILLGMTYLEHVDLKEANGVLSLSRDW